jgi:hypothetical protein
MLGILLTLAMALGGAATASDPPTGGGSGGGGNQSIAGDGVSTNAVDPPENQGGGKAVDPPDNQGGG